MIENGLEPIQYNIINHRDQIIFVIKYYKKSLINRNETAVTEWNRNFRDVNSNSNQATENIHLISLSFRINILVENVDFFSNNQQSS